METYDLIEYLKLYKLPIWLNVIFVAFSSTEAVLLAVICFAQIWPAAVGVFVALSLLVAFFVYHGVLQYVCYNGKYVKYKDIEYAWSEVKITVVCVPTGRGVQYRILFCDRFLFGKDVNRTMRKGFWVFCTEKNLAAVLQYYENRISVVMFGESTDYVSNKKLKKAVDEHNARFFERANSEFDASCEKARTEQTEKVQRG